MEILEYRINSENGIHARPAGMLVKCASGFKSNITVYRLDQSMESSGLSYKNGKSANAKGLFPVMGLGVKCGDAIVIEIEGEDEEQASSQIKDVLENNFNAYEVESSDICSSKERNSVIGVVDGK